VGDLLLRSKDRRFGLSLKESILLQGLSECADSETCETGGILVGYYTPAHDCAVVTALSGPPKNSIRKARLFVRGTEGIQGWIYRLWREQRHYYLGEWHFHPRGMSFPSRDDIQQMEKLSRDASLKCPEPILLIIGGDPKGSWKANAFVFPVDQEIVPLFADAGRRPRRRKREELKNAPISWKSSKAEEKNPDKKRKKT